MDDADTEHSSVKTKKRKKLKQRQISDSDDEVESPKLGKEEIRKRNKLLQSFELLNQFYNTSQDLKRKINSEINNVDGSIGCIKLTEFYESEDKTAKRQIIENLRKLKRFNKLKNYQKCGVYWLILVHAVPQASAILADEMGLGKTAQICVFIEYLYRFHYSAHNSKDDLYSSDSNLQHNKAINISKDNKDDVIGKEVREVRGRLRIVLIVVPVNILDNWVREFGKWTSLGGKVVVFHGNKSERLETLCKLQERASGSEDLVIIVTTSGMVNNNELKMLKRFEPYEYVIVDEAHLIKNSNCIIYKKLLNNYAINNKILLTGTPIQNSLDELCNLLQFAMPHIFNSVAINEAIFEILHNFGFVSSFVGAHDRFAPVVQFILANSHHSGTNNVDTIVNEDFDASSGDVSGANLDNMSSGNCSDYFANDGGSNNARGTNSEGNDSMTVGDHNDTLNYPNPVKEDNDSSGDTRAVKGVGVVAAKEEASGIYGCINGLIERAREKLVINEELRIVQRLTTPFILRRLKKNVLGELPRKHSLFVPCKMAPFQLSLYNSLFYNSCLNNNNNNSNSNSNNNIIKDNNNNMIVKEDNSNNNIGNANNSNSNNGNKDDTNDIIKEDVKANIIKDNNDKDNNIKDEVKEDNDNEDKDDNNDVKDIKDIKDEDEVKEDNERENEVRGNLFKLIRVCNHPLLVRSVYSDETVRELAQIVKRHHIDISSVSATGEFSPSSAERGESFFLDDRLDDICEYLLQLSDFNLHNIVLNILNNNLISSFSDYSSDIDSDNNNSGNCSSINNNNNSKNNNTSNKNKNTTNNKNKNNNSTNNKDNNNNTTTNKNNNNNNNNTSTNKNNNTTTNNNNKNSNNKNNENNKLEVEREDAREVAERDLEKLRGWPLEESLFFESCKVNELLRILREKAAQGEKVVVFSQFTTFLDVIEAVLKLAGLGPFLRLDGQLSPLQKFQIIHQFNRNTPNYSPNNNNYSNVNNYLNNNSNNNEENNINYSPNNNKDKEINASNSTNIITNNEEISCNNSTNDNNNNSNEEIRGNYSPSDNKDKENVSDNSPSDSVSEEEEGAERGHWILLVSKKVGGVGLDLASCRNVVLMDQSWNPFGDLQCEDRCHRLGQALPVWVFRLFVADSVEEYIISRSLGKLNFQYFL